MEGGGEGEPTSPPLPLLPLPGGSEFTLSTWGREGGGYRDKVNSLCPSGVGRRKEGGGEGGVGPLEGVGPENHIKLTTCSTEYRIKNTEAATTAKLMYIKLPMYLFFNMALALDAFDGDKFGFATIKIIAPRAIYRYRYNRYINS
jgi:hypothetical protein